MTISRLAILSVIVALSGGATASAQSLRGVAAPAEFPPASYTATQYVDSQGCVFVRAGVGGNVTWVPRMTRSRQPLCGFTPSLARATPAPEPAPQSRTAAAPAQPPATARPRTALAPAPKPAPRTVAAAKPAPRIAAAPVPRPAAAAPAPRPAATAPRAIAAAPAPAPRSARVITPPDPNKTACAGLTGVSAAYMVQHGGSPVRCGPQTTPYVTYASGSAATGRTTPPPGSRATPESVPPRTYVAPARVYRSQQSSRAGISVPEGMKPVWDDDRLNPRRAHQTFEGKAQMEVMWTNTVPRRLIDRRTGADVFHNYPGLQPPFTSFEAQRAAGVRVATRGVYVPDPKAARRPTATKTEVVQAARRAPAPTATVSTRSAPAPARPRYAQAGIFADPAQARAAAGRIARAGLPARQGRLSRDGRDLTLVLAGPFASQAEAERGVARLRGLGFGNVRLR
ncbi:MAG: hypothetical protein CMN20_06305 [Roseovarius sp.]|nr:hypothetical protein [Roseovarius sp.]